MRTEEALGTAKDVREVLSLAQEMMESERKRLHDSRRFFEGLIPGAASEAKSKDEIIGRDLELATVADSKLQKVQINLAGFAVALAGFRKSVETAQDTNRNQQYLGLNVHDTLLSMSENLAFGRSAIYKWQAVERKQSLRLVYSFRWIAKYSSC